MITTKFDIIQFRRMSFVCYLRSIALFRGLISSVPAITISVASRGQGDALFFIRTLELRAVTDDWDIGQWLFRVYIDMMSWVMLLFFFFLFVVFNLFPKAFFIVKPLQIFS